MDLERDFWTEAVAGPVPELPDSDWIARYRLGNRIRVEPLLWPARDALGDQRKFNS